MAYFNDVTLIGTVAKDPQVYYTRSGTAICDLTIAVKEQRIHAGERIDEVSFFDVTAFKLHAENAMKYLHKGDSVMVNGKLKQDRWEDSEGVRQEAVRVLVQDIQFLNQTILKQRSEQRQERPERKEPYPRPERKYQQERPGRSRPVTKPVMKPELSEKDLVPEIPVKYERSKKAEKPRKIEMKSENEKLEEK